LQIQREKPASLGEVRKLSIFDTPHPDNGGVSGAGYLAIQPLFAHTTPWPIPHLRLYRLHSHWRLSEHRFDVYSSRSTFLFVKLMDKKVSGNHWVVKDEFSFIT
jgi:hypothetical protein